MKDSLIINTSECYGKTYGYNEHCNKCKLKKYCSTAKDPELLTQRPLPEKQNEAILNSQYYSNRIAYNKKEIPKYTQSELLEVICFMASLDYRILKVLELKIQNPTLNLAELAAKKNVSRQALHRQVKLHLERVPELAEMLTYRKKKQQINSNLTFMEKVCQIKKQTQELRLKRQKHVLSYLKKWNYSNQNSLLSQMNIIKGSVILRRN